MRDLEKNRTGNGASVFQKLLTGKEISSLLPKAISCDFSKLKIKVKFMLFCVILIFVILTLLIHNYKEVY